MSDSNPAPTLAAREHAEGYLLPTRHRRTYLVAEYGVLFVLVPFALFLFRQPFGQWIIPSLVGLGIGCTVVLWRDPSFERRRLWRTGALRPHLGRIGLRFVLGASALSILVGVLTPDLLLRLPRENLRLWLAVMVLYPVFSVYPQEIIFRTFLFHRYRYLFTTTRQRVLASGVAFALAHLFFANWIAPVLSLLGGVLFAQTYARSRSTLVASLEHGLWGDLIFTIGLGWYFYGGAIT